MRDSPAEYLTLLRQCLEQTETAFRQTDDFGRRAVHAATALRTLWPSARLVACRLRHAGSFLGVLDGSGVERADWVAALEDFLTQHDSAGEAPTRYPASLPPELLPAGHALVVQPLVAAGQAQGELLLAVADDLPAETTALLGELLRAYGSWLATQFTLEAVQQDRSRIQQLATEETELAELAVLASPVAHEFNNFLNTLLLQLMVLTVQAPEQFRADLSSISRQGKAVAALVRQWQQRRPLHRIASQPLDLNAMIQEVVAELAAERPENSVALIVVKNGETNGRHPDGVTVRLALAADLPAVEATPLYLRLLLRLLVSNAVATVSSPAGIVTISTRNENDGVMLSVEDTGPEVAPALLPRLFDLGIEPREGPSQLELAACEGLVQRRLRGHIRGENRVGGGIAVRIRLRRA